MLGIQLYQLEFHICRQARDRYQFDEAIYMFSGNVVFANIHAARVFAEKMNAKRDLHLHPEHAIKASQVNAMALIDEILHIVVEEYRRNINPQLMQQAIDYIEAEIGPAALDRTLRKFFQDFPTVAVYRGMQSLDEYMAGSSRRPEGNLVENRQIVLEELLMLWLANMNPAFNPFNELFSDTQLKLNSEYSAVIDQLNDYLRGQPQYGPTGQSLIDLLRSPALQAPDSLMAQLKFMRQHWGSFLGSTLDRVLSSTDMIKEEEKPVFALGGPGPTYVYEFNAIESEPEHFSPDKDWMPNLVLIAKNSYVWLDQLSKKYARPITQLSQVPDVELEEMARWGITGLWLIGLWERSMASQRIKQLRGNPEAVASAYSLFSYDIAVDLGGEAAYQELRDKAWKFGIRLASDMVPNHMGIDSRWVIEHPDWFISLDYSPFPSYTFYGPNLSWDTRVGLYLEDHYYNNRDAAVVFKRVDQWTGSEKYIYHGNDGTSMPWNDTAQLNYLIPDVREAVIQTIIHVAKKFPIIRFDAAMTLAKKHYQRLWYPEPGSGGDIPSRAEHGMTKAAFDEVFPVEFWREVVDRVAEEAPDTLLLAEAFWMMEGYFVRSLGMHRVYNSAFMNMLRDEKNQEYRLLIKNTLEFEPEILKRYVNFMNNPDERTAVDQFGKGDKYFGICTLMATMPGLPMFGHGQVEGFTEKYGMEYRKAYWDETVDNDLVERHKRQLFPLTRKRYLFAQVENFLLYNFTTSGNEVNEDVFAYSNQVGEERTLVVYHNKYATAKGWIKQSTGILDKNAGSAEERPLTYPTLGEKFGLHPEQGYFTIFRDPFNQLEFLRSSQELCELGLFMQLNAYECHVFTDFREVTETNDKRYAQLAAYLQGGGAPNIEEALTELLMQSIHAPLRELINPGMLSWLTEHRSKTNADTSDKKTLDLALDELDEKVEGLLQAIQHFSGEIREKARLSQAIHTRVLSVLALSGAAQKRMDLSRADYSDAWAYLHAGHFGNLMEKGDPLVWDVLLSWSILSVLSEIGASSSDAQHGDAVEAPVVTQANAAPTVTPIAAPMAEQRRSIIDEWALGNLILSTFRQRNLNEDTAKRQLLLLKILTQQSDWSTHCQEEDAAYHSLSHWVADIDVQRYWMVHRYQDVLWFNQESFEGLAWWLFSIAAIAAIIEANQAEDETAIEPGSMGEATAKKETEKVDLLACYRLIEQILQAMQVSNFQVDKLLLAAKGDVVD